MVGDAVNDIVCAQDAGVKAIAIMAVVRPSACKPFGSSTSPEQSLHACAGHRQCRHCVADHYRLRGLA